MEWFDRVLAKRDDVIPSFMSVDAINSYVDKSMHLDQPEMTGAETAADIALGFVPYVGTAMGYRDFERARRDDDKLGMGLGILSMIPFAGGAVRAGRKGVNRIIDELDMSHEARMNRAKEMGFDRQLTHASPKTFIGSPQEAEARQLGMDWGIADEFKQAQGGTYFAPENDLTESIFGGDELGLGGVADYMVRSGKNFNATSYARMTEAQKAELEDVLKNVIDEDDIADAAARADVTIAEADPFEAMLEGDLHQYYERNIQNNIMEGLRRRGYDSVTFPTNLAMGDKTPSTVVFDPSNIRSVNAAFDPAKKDSANLLASLGALGLGVGGAASMFAPQQANASDETWYEKVLKK